MGRRAASFFEFKSFVLGQSTIIARAPGRVVQTNTDLRVAQEHAGFVVCLCVLGGEREVGVRSALTSDAFHWRGHWREGRPEGDERQSGRQSQL